MSAQLQPAHDEASLLDVMPWLISNADTIAFEMALAWYWIDPIGSDFITSFDAEENLGAACLHAAHQSMPDVYCQLVADFWHMNNTNFEQHARAMLDPHIPTESIYADDAETFWYLPYEAMGADPEWNEWVSSYDDDKRIAPIMEARGFTWDHEGGKWDDTGLPDRGKTTNIILDSLEAQSDPVYHNVAMVLRWLTKSTQNSLVDWTFEELAEGGADYFTWADLDFAWDVQLEAYDLMDQIYAGLDALEADPVLNNAFVANYQTVQRSMVSESQKPKISTMTTEEFIDGYKCPDIQWPNYDANGRTGYTEAQAHADYLRLWRNPQHGQHQLRR